MSDKRFSETERNCYYTSLVFDNQTQEELGTNKSVKLLNAFYEENEQLRQFINKGRRLSVKELIDNANENELLKKKTRELEKENEILKKQKSMLDKFLYVRECERERLKEKNEQLRQTIKHCSYVDVDNANGCMNCKYVFEGNCLIMCCGVCDYIEGISKCDLKYWALKDE